MGLPGHRRTSSHKRRRAAHFALKKMTIASCPSCHEPIMAHRACANCGAYNGRVVIAGKKQEAHDHAHHNHK
jgi:large subunit ribosomal protein L32